MVASLVVPLATAGERHQSCCVNDLLMAARHLLRFAAGA